MESPVKVIAAFLGVFIAGAVFGGFFTLGVGSRWTAQNPPAAVVAPAPATVATTPATTTASTTTSVTPPTTATPAAKPPTPAAAAQRAPLLQVPQSWQAPQLLRRYAERLGLTPEQKEKIIPLIQRATEDYRRVQNNTFRETGIILQRLHDDIAKELTPPQRENLEKWQEKQREMLQRVDPKQPAQKKAAPRKAPGATSGADSTGTTTAIVTPAETAGD